MKIAYSAADLFISLRRL